MKSSTTRKFRVALGQLPASVQLLTQKQFKRWQSDPHHPSLHFKKVGKFWSARVGLDYRALAVEKAGQYVWFWIGHHDDYDQLLK